MWTLRCSPAGTNTIPTSRPRGPIWGGRSPWPTESLVVTGRPWIFRRLLLCQMLGVQMPIGQVLLRATHEHTAAMIRIGIHVLDRPIPGPLHQTVRRHGVERLTARVHGMRRETGRREQSLGVARLRGLDRRATR